MQMRTAEEMRSTDMDTGVAGDLLAWESKAVVTQDHGRRGRRER